MTSARPIADHALWPLAWATAAGLVAATGVTERSLWQDEAITAGLAHGSLEGLWDGIVADRGNMALFYAVEHLLAPISSSDVWLRVPSLISFGVLVGLLWSLANRVSGSTTAHISAALAVTSVALVYHGQEARSYASTAAVAVALVWLLDLGLREPGRRRRWATLVVLSVAGVYLHVVMLFFLPGLYLLGFWRSSHAHRLEVVASAVVAALATVPLAVGIALGGDEQVAWLPSLGPSEVARIGVALTGSHFLREDTIVAAGLALTIAAVALFGGWRIVAEASSGRGSFERSTPGISPLDVAVVGILSPLVLMLVVSLVSPLTAPRYYLHLVPFVLYSAAIGLQPVRGRVPATALLGVLLFAGVLRNLAVIGVEDVAWAEVEDHVEAEASAGDVVHAIPYYARAPFDWYHWRDGQRLVVGLPPRAELDLPQHPYPEYSTGTPASGSILFLIQAEEDGEEAERFLAEIGVPFTVIETVDFGEATVWKVLIA